MDYQFQLLKSYQQKCQVKTLREMSSHSGIGISRIFRLLHGSPMKWQEYETFKRLITEDKNQPEHGEYQQKFQHFLALASHEDKNLMTGRMDAMARINMYQYSSNGGV